MLPAASVAVHVIRCVPIENGPLVLGVTATVPSISSVAEAVPRLTLVNSAVASLVLSGGTDITGALVSRL
jgi:hypothetical protein